MNVGACPDAPRPRWADIVAASAPTPAARRPPTPPPVPKAPTPSTVSKAPTPSTVSKAPTPMSRSASPEKPVSTNVASPNRQTLSPPHNRLKSVSLTFGNLQSALVAMRCWSVAECDVWTEVVEIIANGIAQSGMRVLYDDMYEMGLKAGFDASKAEKLATVVSNLSGNYPLTRRGVPMLYVDDESQLFCNYCIRSQSPIFSKVPSNEKHVVHPVVTEDELPSPLRSFMDCNEQCCRSCKQVFRVIWNSHARRCPSTIRGKHRRRGQRFQG